MSRKLPKRVAPTDVAEKFCLSGIDPDIFEKRFVDNHIGYGLFSKREVSKGSFLLEYRGVHAKVTDGHGDDEYTYYYTYNGVDYRIDPSTDSHARWANDEHRTPNCVMKQKVFQGSVHLCLFALENMQIDGELRYNYGPSDMPWRQEPAKKKIKKSHVEQIQPTSSQPSPANAPLQVDVGALNYIFKVKNRFQGQPEVYTRFVQLLQAYESSHDKSTFVDARLSNEVCHLFKEHEDLIVEFEKKFLPHHDFTGISGLASPTSRNTVEKAEVALEKVHLELQESLYVESPDHELSIKIMQGILNEDYFELTTGLLRKSKRFIATIKQIKKYKNSEQVRSTAERLHDKIKYAFLKQDTTKSLIDNDKNKPEGAASDDDEIESEGSGDETEVAESDIGELTTSHPDDGNRKQRRYKADNKTESGGAASDDDKIESEANGDETELAERDIGELTTSHPDDGNRKQRRYKADNKTESGGAASDDDEIESEASGDETEVAERDIGELTTTHPDDGNRKQRRYKADNKTEPGGAASDDDKIESEASGDETELAERAIGELTRSNPNDGNRKQRRYKADNKTESGGAASDDDEIESEASGDETEVAESDIGELTTSHPDDGNRKQRRYKADNKSESGGAASDDEEIESEASGDETEVAERDIGELTTSHPDDGNRKQRRYKADNKSESGGAASDDEEIESEASGDETEVAERDIGELTTTHPDDGNRKQRRYKADNKTEPGGAASDDDKIESEASGDETELAERDIGELTRSNPNDGDKIEPGGAASDDDDTESEKVSTVEENSEDESDDENEPLEDMIIRDVLNKDIYVTKVQKSNTTKKGKKKRSSRVYNGRNSCPFCNKLCSNFSQHIFGHNHEEEPEVCKIRGEQEDKERKRLIRMLRNKGNHMHNCEVLKQKKGLMLLSRRNNATTEEISFDCFDYGPCPGCMEWLRTSIIPRHNKTCPGRNHDSESANSTKGGLLLQSNIMAGRVSGNPSKLLIKEVYPIMQTGKVGRLAQEDPLIITIGNLWIRKNVGNKLMRKQYTSCAMRLASRLLIKLRALVTPCSGTFLDDYLKPKYFDHVAHAALLMCIPDDDDEENLQAPSNALKLAIQVKKLCMIKRADAIKNEDERRRKDAKQFLELIEAEWDTKLQRLLLSERKFRKNDPLPLPTDIEKLSVFMKKAAEDADLQDTSYENYRRNVIIALGSTIGYNRRRPGDVQALTLKDYQERKSGLDDVAQEALGDDVTQYERHLLMTQDVITIRAKGNKYLPLLVTEYVRPILEYLSTHKYRQEAGILSGNEYLFANNRTGVIRGGFALNQMAENANLCHPERVRATNCRKFMATMIQGLNVSPQEQQWIVDHMGHNLDIHRIHYRATSDVLERTDIAKVLLMLDHNKMTQYKGMRIQDIDLEELMDDSVGLDEQEQEFDSDIQMEVEVPHEQPENEDYLPDEDEDEDAIACPRKIKKQNQKKKVVSRHNWTNEEIGEIKKLFTKYFKMKKTPGEEAVRVAMAASRKKGGSIWKLPLKNIKCKVSWMRLHPKDNA